MFIRSNCQYSVWILKYFINILLLFQTNDPFSKRVCRLERAVYKTKHRGNSVTKMSVVLTIFRPVQAISFCHENPLETY